MIFYNNNDNNIQNLIGVYTKKISLLLTKDLLSRSEEDIQLFLNNYTKPLPIIVEKKNFDQLVVTIVNATYCFDNFVPQPEDKCVSLLYDATLDKITRYDSFVIATTNNQKQNYDLEKQELLNTGDTRGFSKSGKIESFSCIELNQKQLELEKEMSFERNNKPTYSKKEVQLENHYKQRELPEIDYPLGGYDRDYELDL